MEPPGDAVQAGTEGGQVPPDGLQVLCDGLPVPLRREKGRGVRVLRLGGLFGLELHPEAGLVGGFLRLAKLPAEQGAGTEGRVGGGNVVSGGGETADLLQNAVGVHIHGLPEALGGGGFGGGLLLGGVPVREKGGVGVGQGLDLR